MVTNLFISLYPEKNEARKRELTECLKRNSLVFDHIWVLAEAEEGSFDYLPDISPAAVNLLPVTVRPTFRTFFNAINAVCGLDDVNLIANSDIYFEEMAAVPQANQCFALTRYEVDANGNKRFLNRNDSQDSWCFRGKIKAIPYADFHLGVPGCDNRICRELSIAGYEVINPSLTIKSYHLHANPTDHAKATKRINPPYVRPNPIAI